MFKKLSAIFISLAIALVFFLPIASTTMAAPQPVVQAAPLAYTGYPLTLLSTSITQVVTTTARWYGDASALDVYLTSTPLGITVTFQHSSNGSDWQAGGTVATSSTSGFSRTVAYGAYYRLIVSPGPGTITPTLRVVPKQ